MKQTLPVLGVIAFASVIAACAPRATHDENRLQPVAMPDLANASAPIAEQLRRKYGELTAIGGDGTATAEARAAAFGELGTLFLAARLFTSAEPALMNAHALAPASARWPYYLGHLRRMSGHPEQAAAFFEQAVALDQTLIAARVWLGRMHLESGRPDQAAAEFTRVQSVPDARFAALVGLGRAASLAGDHARAVQHFEAALAANPDGSAAHYPLSVAYRALGDTNRADAHLRLKGNEEVEPPDPLMDALLVALESPMSHQRRGVQALNRGALDEAASEFRKGLELEPEPGFRLSLMHKLATTLFLQNDVNGAIAQLEAGIRVDPTYALNHFTLGVISASRGDSRSAVTRFAEAIKQDPDYAEAHIALGNTLRQTGQAEAALPHFESAVVLSPRSADARYGYAFALADLRRFREARAQLMSGHDAHPADARFTDALKQLDRSD